MWEKRRCEPHMLHRRPILPQKCKIFLHQPGGKEGGTEGESRVCLGRVENVPTNPGVPTSQFRVELFWQHYSSRLRSRKSQLSIATTLLTYSPTFSLVGPHSCHIPQHKHITSTTSTTVVEKSFCVFCFGFACLPFHHMPSLHNKARKKERKARKQEREREREFGSVPPHHIDLLS